MSVKLRFLNSIYFTDKKILIKLNVKFVSSPKNTAQIPSTF